MYLTKMNGTFKKTKRITAIQDSIQTDNTKTYTNEYHNNQSQADGNTVPNTRSQEKLKQIDNKKIVEMERDNINGRTKKKYSDNKDTIISESNENTSNYDKLAQNNTNNNNKNNSSIQRINDNTNKIKQTINAENHKYKTQTDPVKKYSSNFPPSDSSSNSPLTSKSSADTYVLNLRDRIISKQERPKQ